MSALRTRCPQITVQGDGDHWTEIALPPIRKGFLRRLRTLVLIHDPAYYAEPNWSKQLLGMIGYFDRFPDAPHKEEVLDLIGYFRFAIAVKADPEVDLDGDDERKSVIFDICRSMDGVLFTPSSLRDAEGRVLLSRGGTANQHFKLPSPVWMENGRIVTSLPLVSRNTDLDHESEDIPPPDADRVARRALVLGAVAARGLGHAEGLIEWIRGAGAEEELEEGERKLLEAVLIEEKERVDASWRVEGLAVLAWALKLSELPAHDCPIDPQLVLTSIGFRDPSASRRLISEASLRPEGEIEAMRLRLLAIHWRVREFSLNPQPLDFPEISRTAWFGPLELTGVELAERDLSIHGLPIHRADEVAIRETSSIAMERHLAINWLCGFSSLYSETDIST